jgi:methionyl-tRNA formyltransferase
MRIVFMGTPEYAVPSLRALVALAPRHEVVGVVTQPDRPKDRSREPQPPEVKTAALKLGLRPEQILQPESVNEAPALDALRALHPDLFCVVSFGGLLRHAALSIPWILPLNAHGSLLPRYRGAAPIQAALLAGDVETGVTIQKMVRKLDAGPILLRQSIPIGLAETAGSLHDRLAALSASCFVEALEILERGHPILEAQDEALATRVGKLTKESGTVDWSREAAYLGRFVRAMSPWPGAWTRIARGDGGLTRRLRICSAALSESVQPGDAVGVGRVVEDQRIKGGAQLGVRCGDGLVLAIATLQPEGGREMSVGEWIRGAGRAYVDGCRLG